MVGIKKVSCRGAAKVAPLPLERNLEIKFKKLIHEAGGRTFKLSFLSETGAADRLVLFPDARIYFVELKRKGKNKILTRQIQIAKVFRKYGFPTYKLETEDEVKEWLELVNS